MTEAISEAIGETTARDPYAAWQPELATMESDGAADMLIVPLVEALRMKGVVTRGSCQGHPRGECRQRSCMFYPELCRHPGQLAVDARTLDPISPLRAESDCFSQIECVTYPKFVWLFRWEAGDRNEAIDRLFALEPMREDEL